MMKKIISFICCLLPMGAGAETVAIAPNVGDSAVSTTYTAWQNAITGGNSVVVTGGNGINATGNNDTVAPGFAVAGDMFIGVSANPGTADVEPIAGKVSNLYVLSPNATGSTVASPFTILSTGDISVGALFSVLDGMNVGVKSSDTNPTKFNFSVGSGKANEGMRIGDNNSTASLTLNDINALTVNGSVIAYGDLTVGANTVSVGTINANAGDMNITSAGAVTMGGLVASGNGATNITAGSTITSNGTIQNNAGTMALNTSDAINVTGSVENKSTANLSVDAGAMTLSGAFTNEDTGAGVTLNLDSLAINGATNDSYSLINNGNFYATVTGQTYLEYGINLSGMASTNEFTLDTGTLVFGNTADKTKWFDAFANNLNNFNVAVRGGDLDQLTTVWNGAAGNTAANMTVLAQNIVANNVQNDGAKLSLKSLPGGNITVNGAVIGNTGETELIASGALTVTGAVSNNAEMTLNGNTVNLVSVSNSGVGSVLEVSSLTDDTGLIQISGNVTNAFGETIINAKDISIAGNVTNNSGTTTIKGSDTNGGPVQIVGSVDVVGGMVNLDALAKSAQIAGALNVGGGTLNLGTNLSSLTVADAVQVDGDVVLGADTTGEGNMNIAVSGTDTFVLTSDGNSGSITIGGNIIATDNTAYRTAQLVSNRISVGGDALVANQGRVIFGNSDTLTIGTSSLDVVGDLNVSDNGVIEIYSHNAGVGTLTVNGGLAIAHGAYIVADAGNISIDGNVYYDGTTANSGLVLDGAAFELGTTATGADIAVGAVSVGNGKSLSFDSADAVNIGGAVNNAGTIDIAANGAATTTGKITNSGTLTVAGADVVIADIENTGDTTINVAGGNANLGNITNSGSLVADGADTLTAAAISHTDGVMDLSATSTIEAQSLLVSGGNGSKVNLSANDVDISGNVSVAGDFSQGGMDAMLNSSALNFTAQNLSIGGNMNINSGMTAYTIDSNVNVADGIIVADGAGAYIYAGGTATATDIVNNNILDLRAKNGITLNEITNNAGTLTLDSGDGYTDASNLVLNAGNLVLMGAGMTLDSAIDFGAMLYQNYTGALAARDINIDAGKYELTTSNLGVSGIKQVSGSLKINTSDIDVGGSIAATDLAFYAMPDDNWLNVNVDADVSGGVEFIGLEKMTVGGNYVFDSNSKINAAILPYATGAGSTDRNYWSTVTLTQDNTLGTITNAVDGAALISVGGVFTSGTQYNESAFVLPGAQTTLGEGQIGISLFDVVDQGTAIWFLHADGGVENFSLLQQMRNLNVRFCNADGSICYNYLDSLETTNGTDSDLPVYISVRDSDGNGFKDSLYIVFDPRFGGPVLLENMKIQPIVAREPDHTVGEYVSAGALDDLLAGQARNKKFYNKTPIEVIPLIFAGTNMDEMANELYNRMEYYVETAEGDSLARFSRLFQVREIEQIAGSVVLNEHTSFRSFEDRMFDEFIWNRNRRLKKAWADFDFGMFSQNVSDKKRVYGDRFSIAGGFDWQESNTLILGLTGRISHTAGDNSDSMDLGYLPGQSIAGRVNIDVSDTNIGLGGYLMKTLGEKTRVYGNAFLDMHVFDVDRTQNFVDPIDGGGTAFSLISEWGLLHDILNQYVVGNIYARAGYNFGFNVSEESDGDDYMKLKSDGYLILTPGYSLTAQKRIYPSAWFQIRPYATIGIEYDVLGAPDSAKYKFAPAHSFTKYDIDIDPLWANIGGGIEFLSATGIQIGVDYRYQYNQDMQLHNIKVSGSYRF